MGNWSYQLTSAGRSAHGWLIDQHWLAGNSYFPCGRIFISCFSEPLGIKIEGLYSLLLGIQLFIQIYFDGVCKGNFPTTGKCTNSRLVSVIYRSTSDKLTVQAMQLSIYFNQHQYYMLQLVCFLLISCLLFSYTKPKGKISHILICQHYQ